MFLACYHGNLGSCSGRSRSKQTATVKLSGRRLFLFAGFLDTERGSFKQRQCNCILGRGWEVADFSWQSPPGYFSCLLSMLAPFVALGKSLKFSGARSLSGVKRHKCMRANAVPNYNSRGSGPHPISKSGILALTYLTKMLWGLMLIQHFEDVKCYISPKYYPTLVLNMLLGICGSSLKA